MMAEHHLWSEIREAAGRPDPDPGCENCGRPLEDLDSRVCRAGHCVIVSCPCGRDVASFGPVGCPTCSPYREPAVRRSRQLYSQRHRRNRRWRTAR